MILSTTEKTEVEISANDFVSRLRFAFEMILTGKVVFVGQPKPTTQSSKDLEHGGKE